jgi:hypothetical protein
MVVLGAGGNAFGQNHPGTGGKERPDGPSEPAHDGYVACLG